VSLTLLRALCGPFNKVTPAETSACSLGAITNIGNSDDIDNMTEDGGFPVRRRRKELELERERERERERGKKGKSIRRNELFMPIG